MWISKKHYEYINKRIAELERQVKIQQLTLEMCKKVDMAAGRRMKSVQGKLSRMLFSDEGLNETEKSAEKNRNLSLLFLVKILREIQEIKNILNEKQYTSNRSNTVNY